MSLLKSISDMRPALHSDRGFSVLELMLTVAVAATLLAMALPVMRDVTQNAKLNTATRLVERELQSARLKAVSANRSLRVRTNCPAAGYVRTVEVLGTAVDGATNRCTPTVYPYPPRDTDAMTRPNYDGPLGILPDEATVTSTVLEFRPDGTVMNVVSNVATTIVTPITLTVTRHEKTKSVTINAAGKVQLQ